MPDRIRLNVPYMFSTLLAECMRNQMIHDPAMRAAARAVYEAVYPSDDWSPVGFEEAERFGTIHYRQAVEAVAKVRAGLADDPQRQMVLL